MHSGLPCVRWMIQITMKAEVEGVVDVQWIIQNTDDVVGGVKKKKEKKTIKIPFITHEEQSLITHLTWTRSKLARVLMSHARRVHGGETNEWSTRGGVLNIRVYLVMFFPLPFVLYLLSYLIYCYIITLFYSHTYFRTSLNFLYELRREYIIYSLVTIANVCIVT